MLLSEATLPISPDAVPAEYHRLGLDRLPDARLVAVVASVVRRPRLDAADSFVLHAPLELAARAALLPHVAPEARERARMRLVALAAGYEAWGPPAPDHDAVELASPHEAVTHLRSAIDAGDLDDVDATSAWLGRRVAAADLRRLLADDVVPRLAAAAHAPIFLYQLPRVAPRGEVTAELLRPLARELARHPDWRLTWHEQLDRSGPVPGAVPDRSLADAIAATPHLGVPESDFIYPLMSQVEQTGVAETVLTEPLRGVDLKDGARVLSRAAAWSMLDEPSDYAPYGWSHCLTMPQAVMGIASACSDPAAALADASTYVVGFRAAMAARPLASVAPPDPHVDIAAALAAEPPVAAGALWHAPDDELDAAVTQIVTRAATAHDAHLVKYTLACLDAAAADLSHARLYYAAAASLAAYWATRGDPSDPLAASG
jgi:hypothetical protein